jgi:transcriptional regulator of acetoin/glycerol metabolism
VRPVVIPVEAASEYPLEEAERVALLDALEGTRWHMTHTAQQLGVSRNTLYRKLRKHGIER